MNEVESTPLGKRNKEEQIWAALRLRRDARLFIRWKELERKHDNPVKKDKHEKNMIFDKTRWWMNIATKQSLRNEMKEWNWNEWRETRSRGSTLITKARTELLEKPTTKIISLIWSYGIQLNLWGDNLPLTGRRIGLEWTKRREHYFTGRINEELGSFMSTIDSNNLREGFRWNITQDSSNDEIDGFLKYLIHDNMWIVKHEFKISRMT